MNADLDYLYAHHAVGLCPEERCVTARANLAALLSRTVFCTICQWSATMGAVAHATLIHPGSVVVPQMGREFIVWGVEAQADAIVGVARDMVGRAVDWHGVLLDALCASDGGNNPFYRDDDDTVALASELASVVRAALQGRVASREGSGT